MPCQKGMKLGPAIVHVWPLNRSWFEPQETTRFSVLGPTPQVYFSDAPSSVTSLFCAHMISLVTFTQ
jgi:hypothetical protein